MEVLETQMIHFTNEITLGNIIQLITFLSGLVLIIRKMSVMEFKVDTMWRVFQSRLLSRELVRNSDDSN
jgi:hypothetical protein